MSESELIQVGHSPDPDVKILSIHIQNKKDVVDMDGENFYIRDKIVIIPKNTHIPDGTVI